MRGMSLEPDERAGGALLQAVFRMIKQRARRNYGQSFFWRPGQPAPSRPPDIEAAVGVTRVHYLAH